MENLVTLTYRSTHSFLIDLATGKLMIDAGWPGSLPALKSQLRAYGIQPAEIRFVLITHTHPDHAGLAQELKQMAGARLILHAKQIPFLPELAASFSSKGGYTPIVVEPTDLVLGADNRKVLASLGIRARCLRRRDTATTACRWRSTAAWASLATCTCLNLPMTRPPQH